MGGVLRVAHDAADKANGGARAKRKGAALDG